MGGLIFYIFYIICASYVDGIQKYNTRPRIYVSNGHLKVVAPPGKNIDFIAEEESLVTINNINVLTTLTKASLASKLTESYQQTLTSYNDRLETLEARGLEPVVYNNSTNSTQQLVSRLSFRRLSRKVDALQRRVTQITFLLIKDECESNPCKNGGTCQDMYGTYLCHCAPGWEGIDCSVDINECSRIQGTDLGCQNGGLCVNTIGSYSCDCVNGFIGLHCTRKSVDCLTAGSELCGHGTCLAQNNEKGYKCLCDSGWTTAANSMACTVDVDECKLSHPPCAAGVQCINVPGSFYCGNCPPGFTGNGYHCTDINECDTNNGGCSLYPMVICINTHGSRVCGPCPAGYSGDGVRCSYQGVCNINNGGCHSDAICRENSALGTMCTCRRGYIGNGIGPNGCILSSHDLNPCSSNPCLHGVCSVDQSDGYKCDCMRPYTGKNCDVLAADACSPNPCLNDGECQNVNNRIRCKCSKGFYGTFCQSQLQGCTAAYKGDNGTIRYPSDDSDTYNHRSNCAWTITLNSTSKVISVKIIKFDLEESPGCRKDWLEIHDGKNTAAHTLGRFCGNKLPLNGTFISTHSSLYFWFRSDAGVAKAGFEITWTAVKPACDDYLAAPHGSIQSPGSPGNYPLNRNCYWRLMTSLSKRFRFHFFSLNIGDNLDCSADYIKFYSSFYMIGEDNVFAKFCNSSVPAPFFSPGSRVTIEFHSDNKDTYPGFQLTYSEVEGIPGCGGTYSAPEGIIQFTPSNSDFATICEYKIQLSPDRTIKINFMKFDMSSADDCSEDYVEIHEGGDESSSSVGRFCGNTLPAPYVSQGNQLTIVSSSSVDDDKNGWKLEYTSVCVKKYSDESGTFNASSSASDVSDCVYLIERPPGNVIILFMKINMPQLIFRMRRRIYNRYRTDYNRYDCLARYVEVRDGDHENATLFGRYCGNRSINITSTHNFLWIKVHSRVRLSSLHIAPVTFTYTSLDVECGGIFRNRMGSIASPTHPDGYYPSNLNCVWTIIAPPQNVIKLTWMTFYMEATNECAYDNIQVFDNNTDLGKGALIGKYCGYTLPPTIFTTSNIMTVIFKTDTTVNMDGFTASYVAVPEKDVCGGNYFTPSGVIKSPKYPEPYPTNRECAWTINVPPGQQILLNVTDFNIETYVGCRYDWLEIRNGGTSASPLIGKYCGTNIPKLIPSHANELYVFFKSDISRSGHGFRITWASTSTGCGGVLTSPTGSLISPHYPEPYSRSTECMWRIITSAGSRIQVVFSDIDLEKHIQCQSDYVQIFDGSTINTNSLGRFCFKAPEPIKSTSNNMLVRFKSDVAFQGRGFQLHYTTVCRNTIKGFRGVIESPNFPNDYPEDQDCLWEIIVSDRNKINITFTHFELERSVTLNKTVCQYDYVEISYVIPPEDFEETNPYTKYGKYCGQQNPGHISLDSDHVQIRFVSDKLLLGSGFRLEWEIFGCGGLLRKRSGIITSPNYPNSYPVSTVCEWRIEVDFGLSIQIEFHEVDVEKDTACDFDSVSVYNGMDETENLLATICSQKNKTVISSTGNFMFVKFKSDYSYHGKGFKAEYTTIPTTCGGKMTAAKGYINSPNYPKNYNKNETCEWFIEVDEGHAIEITFEDVDLFNSHTCLQNYVKIHDGPSAAFPVLKTVCGDVTPNETIKSTYNEVFIEFRAHTFITTKGFRLTYQKSCGSRITTQGNGVIEVGQDEFTDTLQTCTWIIVSTDLSKHVSLTISQLTGQYFCDEEDAPLKIYNGESSDSPLVGQYCGPKVPPTIVSDGSALTININSRLTFFATYSVYDSHCGGTLMSAEGYFATPGYPKKYATNIECEWILQIAPGNHMSLRFIEFDLLSSENCNTDYLEIRSNNASGKLLGVYCGQNAPENITHIGNLWLLYKASKPDRGDSSITAKGFYAEYALNDVNELSGKRGEIWSPLYPLSITEYKTYSWKITVSIKKRVLLSFKEFYLDAKDSIDEECYFATFEVFDGVDETANSLGKYCGLSLPEPIKSTSNIMFIRVDYNSPRLGSKFKVEWEEVQGSSPIVPIQTINTNCGNASSATIDISEIHNFTLTSPGYPDGYEANLKCEWIFSTIPMKHLMLYFLDMDFAVLRNRFAMNNCAINDKINIYQKRFFDNDWQKIQTACKMSEVEHVIHATDLLKIEFVTTRFLNGTGFKVRIMEACGGWLREPSGYIILDNTTSHGKECQWNITVRSTKTIELIFEEMRIEHDPAKGCDNYLMVRNGKFADSPMLGSGKYCGITTPEKLLSTSNNLFIKYKGSSSVQGFRLRYQEVSANCGGRIVLSQFDNFTEISSPNYPNIPNPHVECEWLIIAPPGESLRIDFEDRFDLTKKPSCNIEYVELRDGGSEYSNLIGRYCESAPSSQFSTDNMMFIKFFTDTDDPKNGFKAKISLSRCGGTIRGNAGDLSHVSTSNANSNCTWNIIGPKDHYLTVTFTKIQIKCSLNKYYVSLEESFAVKNGFNGTLGRYCGNQTPAPSISFGNKVTVNFVTDNSGKFTLSFKASQTECGGKLTAESDVIESPGYPVMDHLNRNCRWLIEVPEGRRITLKMIDFDFGFRLISYEKGIAFYDGGDMRVRLASVTSATTNVGPVESSSNKMTIIFWSWKSSEHRGFKARYTSNLPSICEGDFNMDRGAVSNPSVRNSIYVCEWIHRRTDIDQEKTFAISITLITNSSQSRLVGSPGCLYSPFFVRITDGDKQSTVAKLCSSTINPITIRSPFLITKLEASVNTGYNMNFTASYMTHDCGGIVHGESGFISSPNYPNKPIKGYECAWLLKVDDGQTINITTVGINLGNDCEKSFLAIYNGDLPTRPNIGKYCEKTKPEVLISQSNSLWIEYKFDPASTSTGFKLKYDAMDSGCGGVFHDKTRNIKTPNYDSGDYPNNAECLWIIESEPGYHIELTFIDRFHLEQSDNCSKDFVEISHWDDDKWVSLGKKCGRDIPDAIQSKGEKMRILFRSNDAITGKGFKAKWEWLCGGTFYADEKPRYIVSPGYPISYKSNLKCAYTIRSRTGQSEAINVRFLDFLLESGTPECKFDNLTFSSAGAAMNYLYGANVYCGDKSPPPLRMRGNLIITFKTDQWQNSRGFKFEYRDDSCGGVINESTIIEKEAYTIGVQNELGRMYVYQPRIHCEWNITAPPNQVAILLITKLEMFSNPMCFGQNLEVYKGLERYTPNRLVKLCGNLVEQYPITSESGKMLVVLESMPTTFKGFQALVRFSHGPAEGCGGFLNLTESKDIRSPNLPDLDCEWRIVAPRDHQIEISITKLDILTSCEEGNKTNATCDCMFVEIRDGASSFSERIEMLCASLSLPKLIVRTSTNNAYVRLFIRSQKNNAFVASLTPIKSVCGTSILSATKETSVLTSPNFGSGYPPFTKCSYSITATNVFDKIYIHFETFDLTDELSDKPDNNGNRCPGDYLQIYEDPNASTLNGLGPDTIFVGVAKHSSLLYTDPKGRHIFCGKEDKPFDYYSYGKSVTISLNSKGKMPKGKGFKIEYSIAGCNRNYTEEQGRIQNGNSRTDCEFSITVPENRTISIYFSQFYFYSSVNCTEGALEVREGSSTGNLISKICGYRLPDPIFSTTNKLYFHAFLKRGGFLMRYDMIYTSTEDGQGCGGNIFNNKGKIFSPLYPNPFRNQTICTWRIRVPVSLHLVLKFTTFDIQGNCEQTHLRIETTRDSNVNSFELCSNYQAGIIYRSDSHINIYYTSSIHNGGSGWIAHFQAVTKETTDII